MEPILSILIALIALAVGVGFGWFLGSRPATACRKDSETLRQERDENLQRFRDAVKDIDFEKKLNSRIPVLEQDLKTVTAERDEALKRVTQLETEAKNFDERLKEFQQAQDTMAAKFGEVGAKFLADAKKEFLDRAELSFQQAGDTNENKIKALLAPVKDTLKRYEENLVRVETDRANSYGELKQAVAQLTQGNESVRKETQRLANVMGASPKARGRWGEEQLRTILESAGLAENVDFFLQSSVADGDRQLRPDCVIKLPGDRCIIVDVKCPLVAFEQAYDEEDEARRADLLKQHAKAMGTYANDLGRKGYWRQFDLSPDFVIMFIPGEHFLSAAAERAPKLIETAFRDGVIIASTINMLALAKIMAGMWRQESLAAQAKEVGETGKKLYGSLAVMTEHITNLGDRLQRAGKAYDQMVGSLERNVIPHAKRFEDLKIDVGAKPIPETRSLNIAVRSLTKVIPPPDEEAAE